MGINTSTVKTRHVLIRGRLNQWCLTCPTNDRTESVHEREEDAIAAAALKPGTRFVQVHDRRGKTLRIVDLGK